MVLSLRSIGPGRSAFLDIDELPPDAVVLAAELLPTLADRDGESGGCGRAREAEFPLAMAALPAPPDLGPLLDVDGAVDLRQRPPHPAVRHLGEIAVVPVIGARLSLGRALGGRAVVEEQTSLAAPGRPADQRLRFLRTAPLRLDVAGDGHALVPVAMASLVLGEPL